MGNKSGNQFQGCRIDINYSFIPIAVGVSCSMSSLFFYTLISSETPPRRECVQLNIKRSTDNTRSVSSPMPSFIQLLLGVLSNLERANTTFCVCLGTFARFINAVVRVHVILCVGAMQLQSHWLNVYGLQSDLLCHGASCLTHSLIDRS